MIAPTPIAFQGADDNVIRGDIYGEANGQIALLMHGGGQTRHSWSGTANRLANDG